AYLPLIELGQDTAWTLSNAKTCAARQDKVCFNGNRWQEGFFRLGIHRVLYWTMAILGWIFVSLLIAGMSGVMKKE
ncbi:MAG: hypothetical protein IID54_02175, partial [Proteobacteria bacterium]|nr:hypothetical protein [Pseudomonadota bacterium]